jgi:hypothetical protein
MVDGDESTNRPAGRALIVTFFPTSSRVAVPSPIFAGGDLYRISSLGGIIGLVHKNHIYKSEKIWKKVHNIPIVCIYNPKNLAQNSIYI